MIDFKNDFPILGEVVYLDSAATSQSPINVIEAERKFYLNHKSNPLRGLYKTSIEATQLLEDARKAVKDFIGAKSSNEIVFTKNATESINLIAYSYGLTLKPQDKIVTTILEHHSNLLPWKMVAEKVGTELEIVGCDRNCNISLETFEKAITPNTKVVAITHLSNVIGNVLDIKSIVKLAHKVGAIVVLDCAQAVAHLPINVNELDVDFLVFSGHKVLAPMGIGVLYGKYKLLESLQPFLYGGGMYEAPIPQKFEAGTVNVGGAVALQSALNYINNVGFDYIQKQESMLTKFLISGLKEIKGVKILGDLDPTTHYGIVSFTVENIPAHDVATYLDNYNICIRAGEHCAKPLIDFLGEGAVCRVSLMFYNTIEDVERLLKVLKNIKQEFGL